MNRHERRRSITRGSILASLALAASCTTARMEVGPGHPASPDAQEGVAPATTRARPAPATPEANRPAPPGGHDGHQGHGAQPPTRTDQGSGIPAAALPHIFEKFYRVPAVDEEVPAGTGLGLAFVRECAEQHGGRVTVTSEEGVGSTFTLCLPLDGQLVSEG